MNTDEKRPLVAVAHVVLETDQMERSALFMQTIGMRPVFLGPQVSVLELRGVVTDRNSPADIAARFETGAATEELPSTSRFRDLATASSFLSEPYTAYGRKRPVYRSERSPPLRYNRQRL